MLFIYQKYDRFITVYLYFRTIKKGFLNVFRKGKATDNKVRSNLVYKSKGC